MATSYGKKNASNYKIDRTRIGGTTVTTTFSIDFLERGELLHRV